MIDNNGSTISNVIVSFSSPMQYSIGYCTSSLTDLPVQPPVEVDKIWTITKTETALIITCSNVEVLNFLFADSSESQCVSRWGRDMEQIMFIHSGTASDFYKAGVKCPAFTVEGSTQGNWTASPTGTTATIKCEANHIFVGSATLTCQEDGSWSSDVPQCDKIG
eukprot:sb/3472636/